MTTIGTIGVIGLGLIGGSMAIDLKRTQFVSTVLGYDKNPLNGATAQKLGIVDRVVSYEQLLQESDLILLSVPADAVIRLLPEILDRCGQRECPPVVMDVCSVKKNIIESVATHPQRARFVATHPMSGTEYSGPEAALSGLFDGKACILCDVEHSDADCVKKVECLYQALNMRLLRMGAESHDLHTAYVSHLSHVISFALALTVLDKEKDEKNIFDLASGGFSSTVRLAKSNPQMWVPIFAQNRDCLLPVVDAYMEHLKNFREAISTADTEQLKALIDEANKIRKTIK